MSRYIFILTNGRHVLWNGGSACHQNGCKFLYWEEEYIHILIERNLVDVLSLLASTEARDEISALVDTPTRIESRHETRCEEATSTSLHSKKKEAR